NSSAALSALQVETSAVPIVFVGVADPVAQGFVESFAKPGGKITGFTAYEPSMGGKWIQLLKEVTPRTRRIAVIYNPETSPFERFLPDMQSSADTLGVEVAVARVHDGAAIEKAVGLIAQAGDGRVVFPLILIRIRMGGTLRSQHSTASRQFTVFQCWRREVPS